MLGYFLYEFSGFCFVISNMMSKVSAEEFRLNSEFMQFFSKNMLIGNLLVVMQPLWLIACFQV